MEEEGEWGRVGEIVMGREVQSEEVREDERREGENVVPKSDGLEGMGKEALEERVVGEWKSDP
jgi:hypothetical protein